MFQCNTSESSRNERNVFQESNMSSEEQNTQKPKKDMDLLHTRTGGAYIPPAKLKMMQEQISDKSSEMYQRLNWERLKKRIHGQVNKANTGNLLNVIRDLLRENVIRGRGLLARSIIQAQSYSPTFSNVYAALVAVINSHFPNIGMLIIHRLLIQFKRCYKRNDKTSTVTISKFIAHLINQQVIHEILALEMMILMLENPTDDSVEVTVAFLKECGAKLSEISPRGLNAIFDRLRSILSDSDIDKRIQYMIEVIFHIRKDKFQAYPALIDELDLIEEDDQITHTITLEDPLMPENELNVFKYDPEFEKNEAEYEEIRRDAIGFEEEDSDEEEETEEAPDEEGVETQQGEKQSTVIIDNTEQNLVAFRRNIYLTIQSSLDFQEAAHKLLKIDLKNGQDVELCNMIVDCCAQQRTYEKFYGLLAERFCRLRKEFQEAFERIARDTYNTIHRFEYNKLRNMACLVAHLLSTDAISWDILDQISLNEEDTTSSGRIYIKIVFQELAEFLGVENLLQRIRDPTMQSSFDKIFPRDNPNNTRFSINFFTTIGLGYLTVDLRLHLDQARKKAKAKEVSSSSESTSSDSDSDESSTSSETDDSDDSEESKRSSKSLQKSEKMKKIPKIDPKESHSSKNIGRKNESDCEDGSHNRTAEQSGEKRKIRSYDRESHRKMEKKYEGDESNGKKHKITGEREYDEERRNGRKHYRTGRGENELKERKHDEKGKRRRRDSNDLESRGKGKNEKSGQDDREDKTNKNKREHKHEICHPQCTVNHSDVLILDKSRDIAKKSGKQQRKELEDQHWYHGLLSRGDIEKLLVKHGDFLVRVTENQGIHQIVLSIHVGERNIHLTIAVTEDGRFQLSALRRGKRFPSIYDLVQYYKIHKIKIKDASGKDIRLGDGVPKPKWLVKHEAINYDKNKPPLGSGNFADVYLGTFSCDKDGKKHVVPVAIKIIKPEKGGGREAKQSMIREGKIMSFYNHENIVQFYGVACDRPPIAIVMEYCPGGSLENHLKKQKENIVIGERIEYCLEAALGMRYLHIQGCLHRDLAARNCLISMDGLVKISDFGLSKTDALERENDVEMIDIPVRWMAPETLVRNPQFSKKSDVWSFGVLLYEIFNLGVKPWPGDENKKIATNIRRIRMPQMPSITPPAIKDLISFIWIKNAESRPNFKIICRKLHDMQKNDLKPPPISEFAVNRIPNVKRLEYIKVEHILDETVEEPEPAETPTITTDETIEGGKRIRKRLANVKKI
uniref:Tyrosine-protein kinase n=1 Tax=Elaeophora elaphi TaxID=1147741 RepID=A0A0R3RWN1_9BILA